MGPESPGLECVVDDFGGAGGGAVAGDGVACVVELAGAGEAHLDVFKAVDVCLAGARDGAFAVGAFQTVAFEHNVVDIAAGTAHVEVQIDAHTCQVGLGSTAHSQIHIARQDNAFDAGCAREFDEGVGAGQVSNEAGCAGQVETHIFAHEGVLCVEAGSTGKGYIFQCGAIGDDGLEFGAIYGNDGRFAVNPEFSVDLLYNDVRHNVFADSDGDVGGVFIDSYIKGVRYIKCIIVAANRKGFVY